MEEAGLEKTLAQGLYTTVAGNPVPDFPDYKNDISSFEIRDPQTQLPFVNQDRTLIALVTKLASDYPYACLVGDPGIGKTMIIDYVAKNIVSDNGLEVIKRQAPDLVSTFKVIRDNATMFTHRDYLLLPNLKDPMEVNALDYIDGKQADQGISVAESFCHDVATILGNYAMDNRTSIRVEFSENEFRSYARFRDSELYAKLYEPVCEITTPDKKSKRAKPIQQDFAMITFEFPDSMEKPKIKASWEFIKREGDKTPLVQRYKSSAGFASRAKDINLKKIEEGLAGTFVPEQVDPLVANLLWDLTVTDVKKGENDFYSIEESFEILKEEFIKYTTEIIEPMREAYKNGEVTNQRQMLSLIKTSEPKLDRSRKTSPRTIDDIVGVIKNVRGKYPRNVGSNAVHTWMDSVVDYFDLERATIGKSVNNMSDEIREIERKDPPKISRKVVKKTRELEDRQDMERRESYRSVRFKLKHGKYDIPIENIMKVNSFRDSSSSGGVTISEVRDFTKDNLYGTAAKLEQDIAPHMIYKTLGDFFKGGILTFPDCFSDFISSIVSEGDAANSQKEVFLSYFQSKIMTVTHEGISFKFKAPRILIGSDNKDPFVTTDGFFQTDQAGLRDRIGIINVLPYNDNTQDVRSGTIRVIRDSLNEFRQKRASQNGDLSMSLEGEEFLLKATLHDEQLAYIDYRSLSQHIEEVCDYAVRNGVSKITPELLKKRTMEKLGPGFFYAVDSHAREWDGWFNWPKSEAGTIMGLSVGSCGISNLIKIQSYFVKDKDPLPRDKKRFEFSDLESNLTDNTSEKGFDLATDWMKNFIYDLRTDSNVLNEEEGWQVKTEFERNWYSGGGPSASLAITNSMISALANQPIFKNRFLTGTINPLNGEAGIIGGTYLKGLIPTRINDLMTGDQNEPLYFLFPAPNLKDLSQDLTFDPFDMKGKIICIPIRNITDTYHLLTCGPEITENDWENIDELGPKSLKEAEAKIRG